VILDKSNPDLVLVHGDTTTAFCGALASFYRRIKVGHIEAGLRTFDKNSPFPEEFNRVAIDSLSDLHFAPTDIAAQNLRNEGAKSVFTVGNTVIDALRYSLSSNINFHYSDELNGKKIVLITTHRRENLGDKMRSCLMGIKDILNVRNDLFAILPVHPNPAVKNIVLSVFENIKNIKICDPMPMKEFHHLLGRSYAVFTDSGGIQEEAAFLGVPLFIMRDATERSECLSLENVHLVGCDEERIKTEFLSFLEDDQGDTVTRNGSLAFGNGYACEKIAKHLLDSICLSII
jgi:UDP-N-acetylglucosamine 2-epimerase (non-hydrolysing)